MKKIIILDDDKNSMDNLKLTIELDMPGYEVLVFQYPEQFEDASINNISLIVLDVMFAGDGEFKGGFDLGLDFYFKYKNENPTIPVIILTKKTKKSIDPKKIQLIKNKGDLFIEKPSISIKDLVKLISLKCRKKILLINNSSESHDQLIVSIESRTTNIGILQIKPWLNVNKNHLKEILLMIFLIKDSLEIEAQDCLEVCLEFYLNIKEIRPSFPVIILTTDQIESISNDWIKTASKYGDQIIDFDTSSIESKSALVTLIKNKNLLT